MSTVNQNLQPTLNNVNKDDKQKSQKEIKVTNKETLYGTKSLAEKDLQAFSDSDNISIESIITESLLELIEVVRPFADMSLDSVHQTNHDKAATTLSSKNTKKSVRLLSTFYSLPIKTRESLYKKLYSNTNQDSVLSQLPVDSNYNVIIESQSPIKKYIMHMNKLVDTVTFLKAKSCERVFNLLDQLAPYCHIDNDIFNLCSNLLLKLSCTAEALTFSWHALALSNKKKLSEEMYSILVSQIIQINKIPDSWIDIMVTTISGYQLKYLIKYGSKLQGYNSKYYDFRSALLFNFSSTQSHAEPWFESGALLADRNDYLVDPAKLYTSSNSYYSSKATRKILPATDIEWDYPIAIVPMNLTENVLRSQQSIENFCIYCCSMKNFSAETTVSCPVMPRSCPFVFCSIRCFMKNASLHEYECQFIHTQLFPLEHETGFTASFILLVVRILIKSLILKRSLSKKQQVTPDNIPYSDPLVKINKLKSYQIETERLRPELWESIRKLSDLLYHFFPIMVEIGLSLTDLTIVICKIQSFVFELTLFGNYLSSESLPESISCLILSDFMSEFSHSCTPNCSMRYEPETNQLILRSKKLIDEGQHITFSYIADLLVPLVLRKHQTASIRVLRCKCVRCTNNNDGDRFNGALRCPECFIGFASEKLSSRLSLLVSTENSIYMTNEKIRSCLINTTGNLWECSNCGQLDIKKSKVLSDILVGFNKTILSLDNMEKSENVLLIKRKGYSALLSKIVRYCHFNHYLLNYVLTQLIGLLRVNPSPNLTACLEFQLLAYYQVAVITDLCDISLVYHALSLSMLLELDAQDPLYLMRALWIVFTNYGSGSILYKQLMHRIKLLSLMKQSFYIPYQIVNYQRVRFTIINKRSFSESLNEHVGQNLFSNIDEDVNVFKLFLTVVNSGNFELVQKIYNQSSAEIKQVYFALLDPMTGLNILGLAFRTKSLKLFRFLLNEAPLEAILATNELKVNLLTYICSRHLDSEDYEVDDKLCGQFISLLFSSLKLLWMNLGVTKLYMFESQIKQRLLVLDKGENVPQINYSRNNNGVNNSSGYINILLRNWLSERDDYLLGGQTALHYAASRNKYACLSTLLNTGIDVNILNNEHSTPLHLAALSDNVACCDVLIKHGANVNAPNFRGETPLMAACYGCSVECVDKLISSGADIMACSSGTSIVCLHAVCAGLTNQFRLVYGIPINLNSSEYIQVTGFGVKLMDNFYTRDGNYTNPLSASVPFFKSSSINKLLYPDELIGKLTAAEQIITLIRRHLYNSTNAERCEDLFKHSCSLGFTSSEFLLYELEQLQKLLVNSPRDAQWDAWCINNKKQHIQHYTKQFLHKAFQLVNLLKPAQECIPASLSNKLLTNLGSRLIIDEQPESPSKDLNIAIERGLYKSKEVYSRPKETAERKKLEAKLKELALKEQEITDKIKLERQKKIQEERKQLVGKLIVNGQVFEAS